MNKLYTQAERERLEKILHRLADEQAPRPKLDPEPGDDGWSAGSMLRDLAVRGYLSWWLTIQPSSEKETAHSRTWWKERMSAACWSWQCGRLLWALREQADAVGKPDSDMKDAARPVHEWRDVDQIVLDIAEDGEAGDRIGEDLWRWAAAHGVFLDDITSTAVNELERAAGGVR